MPVDSTCPACKSAIDDDQFACRCGYGVRPRPFKPIAPRYLGHKPDGTAEEMANGYRCARCGSYGSQLDRVAVTSGGFAQLMDMQNQSYLALTCDYCAAVQLFDAARIEGSGQVISILDLLGL